MSNISDAFKNGKAFIGFVTAGDPDLDTSLEIMTSMAQGGCDLIEIGIPFSDPIAEGPVIQEADLRSLENGTTTDKVFDLTKKLSILMFFLNTAMTDFCKMQRNRVSAV